jgi:flagellar protein FlaG
MTAVSFAATSFSPIQVPSSSAPRAGEGVIAVAKSSPIAEASPKIVEQQGAGLGAVKTQTNPISKEELASLVHDLQVKMDKLNPSLAFVLDQTTGKALIQLTDRNTNEVIQQFPSAAAIQISKALDRFEKGQLINKTA